MATQIGAQGGAPSQPFFMGAPLSKLVTLSVVGTYIVYETQGIGPGHESLEMDVDKIINEGQLYRFFTGHSTFGNGGDLVMGITVLSLFARRFEREMGTRKFATFLFFVSILSTGWEVLFAQVLAIPLKFSGPYPWIGALFILFHMYTPRMHPRFFGILGFHFSEKSIQYAFCIQVASSGWLGTILPTLSGMIAGYLASSHRLPFSKIEIPDFLCRHATRMGERFVEDPPPILSAVQPRTRVGATPGGEFAAPAPRPPRPVAPPSPPSEVAIEQLTSMGFDRESVIRALQRNNNNIERAADRLLSGT